MEREKREEDGRKNAHEIGLGGNEQQHGAVVAAALPSPAASVLRSEPFQPRRWENVLRVKPHGFSTPPFPLLPLFSHSPLSRILHFSLLRFPQKPSQLFIQLEEAPPPPPARRRPRRRRRWRRRPRPLLPQPPLVLLLFPPLCHAFHTLLRHPLGRQQELQASPHCQGNIFRVHSPVNARVDLPMTRFNYKISFLFISKNMACGAWLISKNVARGASFWFDSLILCLVCLIWVMLCGTEHSVRELECSVGERWKWRANGHVVAELNGQNCVQKPCDFLRRSRHFHAFSAQLLPACNSLWPGFSFCASNFKLRKKNWFDLLVKLMHKVLKKGLATSKGGTASAWGCVIVGTGSLRKLNLIGALYWACAKAAISLSFLHHHLPSCGDPTQNFL